MITSCVVVIGHVDHGKTSLVHALTGIETDRLPEEKARGLSIAPGFAHHTYPGGILDFVDAPGHQDFIHAMISGASGAQSALVVIAADEGIGIQTREHLCIAGLLGITTGVVAVTKSDLLKASERSIRLQEVRATLADTPFANAQVVFCSASTLEGVESLHAALETLIHETPEPRPSLTAFLPIDRAFSLAGRGTIVTGTLLGQNLSTGDCVFLQPANRRVSIRGLQSRNRDRATVHAGERVAVNLRGIAPADIPRGAVLAGTTGSSSNCIDVLLTLLPSMPRPLKHMQDVRVFLGTSSEVAQVRLFGGGRISAGETRFAQLRFKKSVATFAGQQAVLRSLSPALTIGGATILDPNAVPATSGDKSRLAVLRATADGKIQDIASALACQNRGVANLAEIARLARRTLDETRSDLEGTFVPISDTLVTLPANIRDCSLTFMKSLATYHSDFPLRSMAPCSVIEHKGFAPALSRHVEETMLASGEIRRQGNALALSAHDPVAQLNAAQRQMLEQIDDIYHHASLTQPNLEAISQGTCFADLVALLTETGRLVPLVNVSLKQTLIFHSNTLSNTATALRAAFPDAKPFTTGEARTALETSRKIIVPILEHFDSQGVTQRTGNLRHMASVIAIPPPPEAC